MKTRHRVPSIFNLSMVDVLCCALGCVILLWLLNLREAKQKAAQAGRADEQAASLRSRAGALGSDLDEARALLADLRAQIAAARDRANESARDLDATRRRLADAEAEAKQTADRLGKALGERDALAARGQRLDQDLASLRSEKASAEAMAAQRTRTVNDLVARLKEAEARARDAEDEAKDARGKLASEEALARSLEKEVARRGDDLDRQRKELTLTRQGADLLQTERRTLAGEMERVRAAAENRFAGITLTGRRVAFIVDMSGSMSHLEEKTPAPDKWPAVRQAVVKVMRSLPELEKFQLILFSDAARTPLGGAGKWIDYNKESPERVSAALEKTRPEGNTNMYVAFEAAFALRAQGLDTIYVFSDGIPNQGPGLSAEQEKRLRPTEQAEVLGRHVRGKLHGDWNRDAGRGRVRINTIGFFFESPDLGAFLWALARENDGSFVGMSKP